MMKVDFNVKKGKDGKYSGTSIMRGVQVAEAGGWTVNDPKPTDVRVIVKKGSGSFPMNAKVTIWDPLDFWPQPREGDVNIWNCKDPSHDIIHTLEATRKKFGIPKHAIILSVTRQMWDILNAGGYRTFYIPHHYQPGIAVNPIRKKAEILGYEGSEKFLGDSLRMRLENIASEFGMRFVVNPGKVYGIDGLSAMDIALSIRSKWHCNIFTRFLKSGVKIANCMASGTPFISQDDYAAWEMDAPYWFRSRRGNHDLDTLREHIKTLLEYDRRKFVSEVSLAKAKSFGDLNETIIPMYRDTFRRLLEEK